MAWTHEVTAWVALTSGDLPQVIASTDAGVQYAPHASVAAQLHAQSAKAWARMKDRHKTELSLDRIRKVLDSQPPVSNLRNHFVVDPTKANFYAMDAYRVIGADDLAQAMADTVVMTSTAPDGRVLSPMRLAEARPHPGNAQCPPRRRERRYRTSRKCPSYFPMKKSEPESLRRSGFRYSRPLIGDLLVGE